MAAQLQVKLVSSGRKNQMAHAILPPSSLGTNWAQVGRGWERGRNLTLLKVVLGAAVLRAQVVVAVVAAIYCLLAAVPSFQFALLSLTEGVASFSLSWQCRQQQLLH